MTDRLPLPFPLSKFMDPDADAPILATERSLVARAEALTNQHPAREWEYAMALHALTVWQQETHPAGMLQLLDVGGAGSGFWQAAQTLTPTPVVVVDPELPIAHTRGQQGYRGTIEQYAAGNPHDQYDALFSLSVLEHVANIRPFLRACRMVLRPGGLLFLTVDAWNSEGPDTAHFHWMRTRIYDAERITKLQQDLRELGFRSFGRSDWTYRGDHLYGSYTFASLAMTRTL